MTKRDLLDALADVSDDAHIIVQLPDNKPPVELVVEVFPESDHTDVVIFPTAPDGYVWESPTTSPTRSASAPWTWASRSA